MNNKSPQKIKKGQVDELREVFCLFDKDGDGQITMNELKHAFRSFEHSLSEEQIQDLMLKIDRNHNGVVDFDEFVELMKPKKNDKTLLESDLTDMYKFFDKDNSGGITVQDLKIVLKKLHVKLSDNEIMDMMKEADLDGDGQVTFAEFKELMMKESHN